MKRKTQRRVVGGVVAGLALVLGWIIGIYFGVRSTETDCAARLARMDAPAEITQFVCYG